MVTLVALLTPGIRPGGLSQRDGALPALSPGWASWSGSIAARGRSGASCATCSELLVGLLAFAALTELGQFLVEDRSPERADIIADAAGSAAGLFTGALAGLILADRPGRRRP